MKNKNQLTTAGYLKNSFPCCLFNRFKPKFAFLKGDRQRFLTIL